MGAGPVLIQVVGDSGSGKTLVVERCVRRLSARGLKVAVVKHSHHSPDLQGKDSARAAAAGAAVVLFVSRRSFLSFRGYPASLIAALPVDVVLIEGYSRKRFGPLRFRVQERSEVPRVARRILAAAPREPSRPVIVLDGRRRSADPLWRFVLGLMDVRGAHEVRKAA